MTFNHYMRGTTHRQHLTLVEWLKEELNHPDRADHYQMQTTWELQRMNARHPELVEFPEHQTLRWGDKAARKEPTKEEVVEQVAHDRSIWHGAGEAAQLSRRQAQGAPPPFYS